MAITFTTAFAQSNQVNGVVISSTDGLPLPGVTVVVKGTTTGTITSIDGNYSIKAPADAVLQYSFIGFTSQEQDVNGRTTINVTLDEETAMLEDLVVIGYGVQKKSVVTASIAKVSAEDLEGKSRLRADDALKGLAAGINVTSASGQPGAKSMIRIRGNGTINNSEPLYIIDGLPTDQNGMELVNPNDIESMEVLKDAASGAIYGARAANGVILVTTKKGKAGKAQINYNASWGWQSAWKHRDVTSATDYAILQNERALSTLNATTELPYADPYNLVDVNGDKIEGFGTDWQELLFNDNAPIMQHDISASGATDKLNYYLSVGYFNQEGIVGGNYGQSNYDRFTLRSNNMYTLLDESDTRNFLNKLDVGVNVSYMRVHNTGIDANSAYGSPLGSALYLSPIIPLTVKGQVAENMKTMYSKYDLYCDENGDPYTIPGYIGNYGEQNNPIAMMKKSPTKNWAQKFMPKFSFDLQLWENLKYHYSYSAELSFWGNSGATLENFYFSGNNHGKGYTSASMYKGQNTTWQSENTLTYDKKIDNHTFGIVLGQSASKFKGDELGGSRDYLVNPEKPYINYATGEIELSKDADGNITGATNHKNVYGGPYTEHTMASLFGRISYDYNERYMVQATVRRDGSSRFGSKNKYGIFPSVSVGWNLTNEAFMDTRPEWYTSTKVRFSWGKNGNDNIEDFGYTSLTAMGNNYWFGKYSALASGSKAKRLANEKLKWEESEQIDLGVDFAFFSNALTFTVDYFQKKTNGMIIEMPIPSYVGEAPPLGNVGDMTNSGVEFELGFKQNIRNVHMAVKGNASYLHNELNNIGNDTGFLNYGISQFSGGGTRAENGKPFPFFYGYKTAGVFQNTNEVEAYKNANGELIMPNAEPGDLIFVDVNGDGKITEDDRTNIGNGTPKWTFGLNANVDWKGIDLSIFMQGVGGADVFDATYRRDLMAANYPTWVLDRWTGEGTSNKVPTLKKSDNWVVSDLYVFDGSYLRVKNVTLGYTLPTALTQKVKINRLRVYAMAENLFTFTKYHGFDPEIGSGSTSLGVDYGVYPQARTYTVGLKLSL
ncbi:MAG: TonB-dependent receptor [Bacteroidales bacterium]|nr:TonB-dependent receptor [Bacteroidales bacterium]